MSKNNWLHYVALRGCLIASLCLSSIAVVQAQSEVERHSGDRSTPKIAAEPEESWDRISPSLLLHFIRRITGALETEAAKDDSSDKTEREKNDLAAQQEMARWAFWMMIAAFIQAAVGAIGIYYLRQTLQQNNKATDVAIMAAGAAKETAAISERTVSHELRPYLGVKQIDWVMPANWREIGALPGVNVLIENFGQTPANNTIYKARTNVSASKQPNLALADALVNSLGSVMPRQIMFAGAILSPETWVNSQEKIIKGDISVYCYGSIEYWDPISGKTRQTNFRAKLHPDTQNPGCGFFTMCDEGNDTT